MDRPRLGDEPGGEHQGEDRNGDQGRSFHLAPPSDGIRRESGTGHLPPPFAVLHP
jgi:hypothetical protein